MTNTCLMPTYQRQPVSFVRGSRTSLWDIDGREYFDAISGVAVTNLGHAHPEIAAVIAEQSRCLLHTSNMFDVPWQESLGQKLCQISDMERVFFCNSGAEANETAIKLARLHSNKKGVENPAILVMENSFHGRTMATLAATGNPAVHRGFTPLMPGFVRVPYDDMDSVREVAYEMPNVVAVLVESVQGEGGVRVASTGYLQFLRNVCDQHGWLMMMDEVQTGLGRTGRWFGYQHADVLPDVITLAKALGNGYPIGACLARGAAARLFSVGHHGSTFGGNPMACRIGCAVIDIHERDRLPQRAEMLGQQLLKGLQQKLLGNPQVAAVRGHGLMAGIELQQACDEMVLQALCQENLLINVTRNRTIRLLPALISTEAEIERIVMSVDKLVKSNINLEVMT